MSRLLHILTVLLTLAASLAPLRTTATAVAPEPQLVVSADEIALLNSVSRWLADEPGPIASKIASERSGFEAFRRWNPREQRREVVTSLPWGGEIFAAAQTYQVDSLLLAAVIEVESGFRPSAQSPRGALGLMQVMPETAGLEAAEDLLVPARNIASGTRYLRYLLDLYQGDLVLALAAYNAGPGAVNRFGGVPPYAETQAYIEKVLAIYVSHHRELWQAGRTPETLVFG